MYIVAGLKQHSCTICASPHESLLVIAANGSNVHACGIFLDLSNFESICVASIQNRQNETRKIYTYYIKTYHFIYTESFLSFLFSRFVFLYVQAHTRSDAANEAKICCLWNVRTRVLKSHFKIRNLFIHYLSGMMAANEHARPGHHSLIRLAWNDNNVNIAHTEMKRIHSIVGLCHTHELNQPFLRFSCPMLAFKRCDRMSECDSFFFCFLFFVPFVNMVTTEENRNKRHKEEMNCDNDRRMVVICKMSYERKFHYCLPQHLK